MSNFSIFSVLGIEIEYMLVDKDTLDIRPRSDVILSNLAGSLTNQVDLGDIALSNELMMHVLELKNNGPKPPEAHIAEHFQKIIIELQPLLEKHNLLLLPTAAHPWMDPNREAVRWPHDNYELYQQFDTIFNCTGHGWSNLQSMHVNLPYSNQEEFFQLHSVIRLILPLLPALAASSPIIDCKKTGFLDSRLYFYSRNQECIPSICGDIIPEFIRSEEEYQQKILTPMFRDISPFDPKGLLQYEWLNSRAAIAKLSQKALEIRIIDTQECVDADIAIAKVISAILQNWLTTSDYSLANPYDTKHLRKLFDDSLKKGLALEIDNKELMAQWQLPHAKMTLRNIWSQLIEKVSFKLQQKEQLALELILSEGNLSERILRAVGASTNRNALTKIYKQLSQNLLTNQQFLP